MDSPKPTLTLLAAEHSYFSAKARSYLRYKGQQGVFFQEALATLDIYKNAIQPLVGVNFIPVLLVHDENGAIKDAIQDTSLIIDYVEANFPTDTPSITPVTPVQKFVSYLVELWADEWLKMPAMHYRWSFLEENQKYLVHEWGLVSTPHLSTSERDDLVLNSKGKGATFTAMKGTLPLLGVTAQTKPEIERSFMNLLSFLEAHFREHKYLLGARPCLGDFAIVGPFYAHLYRDPKPSSILRSHAPALCEYLERMNGMRPAYEATFTVNKDERILRSSSIDQVQFGRVVKHGDFLPNDFIPNTLLPILKLIFEEHIPVLLSTCQELSEFFSASTVSFDTPLPRTTGYHQFKLGKAVETRLAYPYDVWMLQRCLDSIDNRSKVDSFIRGFSNGDKLLSKVDWINKDLRLRLVNFKLYRDQSIPPSLVQSKI